MTQNELFETNEIWQILSKPLPSPKATRIVNLTPSSIPAMDICENRHRRNKESIAANATVDKTYWQTQILDYAKYAVNIWLKDVCRHFNKPPNEISPRLAELKAMGLLVPTGERIEKCGVFRLKR